MAHVKVTVNGRDYQIACDDGQETHVGRLGRYLDQKVASIVKSVGQVGDQRLLVMAALMIADDLVETDNALTELRGDDTMAAREARANAVVAQPAAIQPAPPPVPQPPQTPPPYGGIDERIIIDVLENLASRVEGIAGSLVQD